MKQYFATIGLFLLCVFSAIAYGQGRILDSLQNELNRSKDDTNKIVLLSHIADILPISARDTVLAFSKLEMNLAKKLQWKNGEAIAVGDRALYWYYMGQYDSAIMLYQSAIAQLAAAKQYKRLAYRDYDLSYAYFEKGEFPNALDAFLKALNIFEQIKDDRGLAKTLSAVGTLYIYRKEYEKANQFLKSALELARRTHNTNEEAHSLLCLGENYEMLKKYDTALQLLLQANSMYKQMKHARFTYMSCAIIGDIYSELKDYGKALTYYSELTNLNADKVDEIGPPYLGGIGHVYLKIATDSTGQIKQHPLVPASKKLAIQKAIRFLSKAVEGAIAFEQIDNIQMFSKDLSTAQRLNGDYQSALKSYELYITYRDSVYSTENQTRFKKLETEREVQLKEKQIIIDKLAVEKKRNERGYFAAGMALLLIVIGVVFRNFKNQKRSNKLLTYEKKRSDDLLLNILPSEVAEELKSSGKSEARFFDDVTVIFTDFVNFTTATTHMTPQELVSELDACFKAFDSIIGKYNIEKIKTVGDAYLAVSGLPVATPDHAANVARAAIEMRDFMQKRKSDKGDKSFQIRLGIHSGSVVAGIVGVKKFAYDIWGDTVNTAARMEQNSLPGKINVSESTYLLVKDDFSCEYRGEISAKNKGQLKMYFID